MHFPFQAVSSVTLDLKLLEQDYRDSQHIENVSLGQHCLYYPGMLKLRYIPYELLQWAYLRAEENHVTMCCGKGYIDIWYLVICAGGKQLAKLEFQQKETAREAFALLTEKNPHMLSGYTEANKKLFASLIQ